MNNKTQELNSETQKVKCHDCQNSIYDKDFKMWWCDGEEVDPDGTCENARGVNHEKE